VSRAWMPLYIGDYLRDTRHLCAAEHGAYLMLIMHYWDNGGLPDDDRRLARIACMTGKQWASYRENIAEFFQPGWVHTRLERELTVSREGSQKARIKAEKRWKNKEAHDAVAEPEQCQSQSQSQSKEEGSVAIATDGKPSSGEVGKIVVRPMPDVPLPEEPLEETARERLWRVGKPALMTLGVPQAKCGQMMGLWLKDAGDNHDRVLGAILRAHEMAPMDPIPWITASLKQDKPNGKAGSIHAAAEELVAWTREREAASRSEAPALLADVRG
jgi:uncharacterized protein YdaU (DUF1376 family)